MPFEAYKARVRIVKDEAVVKKWLEEQSWKAEYIGLNLPEPVRFADREQVEQHFRATHLPNLIKNVEEHTLTTPESRRYMSRGLRALLRHTLDEQRRFPLKVASQLSQQLAGHGLHFFKVNKTVVHVCVARPHHLDLNTAVVSDRVRRIIEFIQAHPGCNRRKLLDALAPAPPPPPAPAPAPASAAPAGETGATEAATTAAAPAPAPAEPGPTPEQTAIITDLHWLIHQGHVIEFTDGRMETAQPPKPKPAPAPKAESQPGAPKAETSKAEPPAAGSPAAEAPQAEAAVPATPVQSAAEPPATPASEPAAPVPEERAATPLTPAPDANVPGTSAESPAAAASEETRSGGESPEPPR
jgi:hypothetical protein